MMYETARLVLTQLKRLRLSRTGQKALQTGSVGAARVALSEEAMRDPAHHLALRHSASGRCRVMAYNPLRRSLVAWRTMTSRPGG